MKNLSVFSVFVKFIDQQGTISGKTLIYRTSIITVLCFFYNSIINHFEIVLPTFILFLFLTIFILTLYSLIYKRSQAFNNSSLKYIYNISFYIICFFLTIKYIEFFDLSLDKLDCDGRRGKAGIYCKLIKLFSFIEGYISKNLTISFYYIAVSFSVPSYFLFALTNSPTKNHTG